MAYQQPNGGQYPSHPQQAQQFTSPHSVYPPQRPQAYPQVVIPAINPYPQQQQPNLQIPVNPHTPVYPTPPFQQHSAPHPSPYEGTPQQPPPYYRVPPNYASYEPYAYNQYVQQAHQSTHSQPQQITSRLPPQAYPEPHAQPLEIAQQSGVPSDNAHLAAPQVVIKSTSLPNVPPKTSAAGQQDHKTSEKEEIDYQLLLLALADEYIDAAHSQGMNLAVSGHRVDLEEYFKLVAIALRCLEVILRWKTQVQPKTEALVRLRFARILYEETDNVYEAEKALTKGIDLCERNKMLDLKYSMQQLHCRAMFKSNSTATLKAVDSIINNAEVYHHTGWEYAFRILRATLLISSSRQESALNTLQKLSAVASRNGEPAISVASTILEALVHLQQSSNADSIAHAQQAIGAARTHQLDPSLQAIPQIQTLIQIVDICCSLLECDISQATQKLQIMQKGMDQNINDPHWQDDGSFSVPLKHATVAEPGDILQLQDGKAVLTLSWLPEHDLYSLCYFLSSVTLGAKNSQDGHKAEKYLAEGLRMVQNSIEKPQTVSESFVSANSRLQWRRVLHCNMLLQRIFLACSRTDWKLAIRTLDSLQQAAREVDPASSDTIGCLIEYSRGIIAQATGDLKSALAIFQKPVFNLDSSSNKTSRNNPQRDTSVLAGLNRVLILREPSQASHEAALQALKSLEPFCRDSPNKYIRAAYSLISATIYTESTIQTKRDLHQALQAAMAISNSQVTCIALTFMSWKYFRGVVGEQSEKSAKAARAMAGKADDKLWMSVTEELLAETLDRQGRPVEANAVRADADKALESLPPALKKTA